MPDALFMYGSTALLDANDAALGLFALSRAAVRGMAIGALFSEYVPEGGLVPVAEARFCAALVAGATRFEWVGRRPDGRRLAVSVSVSRLPADGEALYLLHCRDVTGQRLLEKRLARDLRRLAGAVDCAQIGAWEWNLQAGSLVVTPAWAEISGYRLADFPGLDAAAREALIHPDDAGSVAAALARHLAGETTRYACTFRTRHRDGSWIAVSESGRVYRRAADGSPLVMLGARFAVGGGPGVPADLPHQIPMPESLVAAAIPELRARLRQVLAGGRAGATVLDMRATGAVDASGLVFLLAAKNSFDAAGATLRLGNVGAALAALFDRMRLAGVFGIGGEARDA